MKSFVYWVVATAGLCASTSSIQLHRTPIFQPIMVCKLTHRHKVLALLNEAKSERNETENVTRIDGATLLPGNSGICLHAHRNEIVRMFYVLIKINDPAIFPHARIDATPRNVPQAPSANTFRFFSRSSLTTFSPRSGDDGYLRRPAMWRTPRICADADGVRARRHRSVRRIHKILYPRNLQLIRICTAALMASPEWPATDTRS